MAKYLITGGTGTIGRALVDRLVKDNQVVVFSRDEDKQHRMRNEYRTDNLYFFIGDVRDYYSIDKALAMHQPDYVFHAAAMKHVPFCDDFVLEGIKTNVLGSNNVFDACIARKVKKVIFLSTDKAVEPSCIMGMSKAIAEKLIEEKMKYAGDTVFCATRFGNVLRSRGSVVPLFEEQIVKGQPLTITDCDMTRFIMNVDDAAALVEYAFENGEQGDLFVWNAPCCRLIDLALAVSEKNGCKEFKYTVIGNRGNEKMNEVLLNEEEAKHSLFNGSFFVVNRSVEKPNWEAHRLESNLNPISVSEIVNLL